MNPRKRLRKNREAMRAERKLQTLLNHHTDDCGNVDLIALNNQLHSETKNPTMEEFFNKAIKSLSHVPRENHVFTSEPKRRREP